MAAKAYLPAVVPAALRLTRQAFIMAPIKHKAGIRETFAARPDLKAVHVLPSGEHYFNLDHAEKALAEGEELVTLAPDSEELKEDEKPAKPAK